MDALLEIPQSVFWGLLPGFLTAFGGAYKDTLFEQFEPLKFFRSPLVALFWYLVFDYAYPDAAVIFKLGLASTLERLSVETYKAIWRPEPGKFKNCKCVQSECVMEKDRGWFLKRMGFF